MSVCFNSGQSPIVSVSLKVFTGRKNSHLNVYKLIQIILQLPLQMTHSNCNNSRSRVDQDAIVITNHGGSQLFTIFDIPTCTSAVRDDDDDINMTILWYGDVWLLNSFAINQGHVQN